MVQTLGSTHLDVKDYARLHKKIHCQTIHQGNIMSDLLVVTILTQYHMYNGLKVFGDSGIVAVMKELNKIRDRMVMNPKNTEVISHKEKKAALQYLMFLKQNRCSKIKGKGCVDGRKQRDYITKNKMSAPTLATEALFLMRLIDDMENRHSATLGIPGSFIQL